VNTVCCLLILMAVILPLSVGRQSQPAQAAVIISKTDPTMGPPRGTPEKALHWAQAKGASPITATRDYIYEVYRLAALVGIDPAVVIAQSALETADWTSFYWKEHLNPAGIGITQSGVPSYTWPSGTAAARFHLARLYVYFAGPIDPANPLYPYRNDGPNYDHLFDLGYDGQAKTIDDLTGRWAVDPIYGQKIANRGTDLFADAPHDASTPGRSVRIIDASGGNDPFRTRDANFATTFAIVGTETPPPGGFVVYDMGRRVVFESINWIFKHEEFADSYDLQTSNDAATWTTLATFGNPPAREWQYFTQPVTTRYVRFLFRNPNGDMNIGYLAEVEFYGENASGTPTATFTPFPSPTATNTPIPTPTPTRTPPPGATETPAVLPGAELPVVGSGGSGIGNSSKYVRDGSIRTTWQTVSTTPPSQAQVYVDLGASGTVNGVEFVFRRVSGARSYQIRVSEDKRSWTTVASFDYADPLVWQRAQFTATARYIQFFFFNPTATSSLGYLAEVKVFGSLGSFDAAQEGPTATPTEAEQDAGPIANESPTESIPATVEPTQAIAVDEVTDVLTAATPIAMDGELPIRELRRTVNSGPATVLVDGDPATVWQSASAVPGYIHAVADLGVPTYVNSVRWLSGSLGITGDARLEVSTDGESWIEVGAMTSGETGSWQILSVGTEAKAVRIVVTNDAGHLVIGGIAEIEILG
jgi:hypothetical protein